MTSKKMVLYVIPALLVIIAVFYYLVAQPVEIIDDDTVTPEMQATHQKKLVEYREYIDQTEDELALLNEKSDALMLEDQEFAQTLQELDRKLGVTQDEFEKQYPEF